MFHETRADSVALWQRSVERQCDSDERERRGAPDLVRAESAPSRELQSYRQRIWIHRDLKVLVQRAVEVIGPDSEILPGSVLTFRWAPLPESDGIWFETGHEFNFGSTVYGVRKIRGIQRHEFYDYRRFQVESSITVEPL